MSKLSPVIDILYAAQTAQEEAFRRLCQMLSTNCTTTMERALIEAEKRLGDASFRGLLEDVGDIVGRHRFQRSITDWPFENFWTNPHEPLHSLTLGYFLDPSKTHECGTFLLRSFFRTMRECGCFADRDFPVDNQCTIDIEAGHIDLSVKRKCDGEKYAVIIENKVNFAINQPKQLETYIELVKQDNFAYNEIFVFYLPLNDTVGPNKSDVDFMRLREVRWETITFEGHILKWLEKVLSDESKDEWPPGMHEGMSENLSHYRNLIKHLTKKQRELQMNAKILQQLEKCTLPTLLEVERLEQAAKSVRECVQQVLRGRLLFAVYDELKKSRGDVWFCGDIRPFEKLEINSPYDSRFGENQGGSIMVCLKADETVSVSFGANADKPSFWFGFMRGTKQDKRISAITLLTARDFFENPDEEINETYYVWAYDRNTSLNDCERGSAAIPIAKKLLKMRDSVLKSLTVGPKG